MRNITFVIMIISFAFFTSCASQEKMKTNAVNVSDVNEIPEFFLNPPISIEKIYGVGSAKLSRLDMSRRLAISRARDDISFQIQAKVESAIVDYAQKLGVEENSQLISFIETVSRQIANISLQGAKSEEVKTIKNGTVYALISFSKARLLKTASNIFSLNEDATFNEFKTKDVLYFLNEKINNKIPATKIQKKN